MVELRWWEGKRIQTVVVNDAPYEVYEDVKVLQYRVRLHDVDIDDGIFRQVYKHLAKSEDECVWSEWQDVPVVREG